MRMKHRWIGGIAVAAALALGACAPPQQGAGESGEPSQASGSDPPAASMQPTESPEASGSAEPTPDDYEY